MVPALPFEVYEHYHPWCLPPDIIKFGPELGHCMATCLDTRRSVVKVLKILDVIEGTSFDLLSSDCREHTSR